MNRHIIAAAAALVLAFGWPAKTQAQWIVGPHVLVSFPSSSFANVTDTGGGFGVKGAYRFKDLGGIMLRGDFAFITYGNQLGTITDVNGFTTVAEIKNEGFRLNVGPSYMFGSRSLKAYVGAHGGLYYYRTNVVFPGFTQIISDSQDDTFGLGWNFGGGLMFDIGLGPLIDVSLEYQTIYNIPSTVDAEPGENVPDITAHELTLKMGVTFFLGRGRR